jgi:hypothetical protein
MNAYLFTDEELAAVRGEATHSHNPDELKNIIDVLYRSHKKALQRLQAYAIDKDDAEKALTWKGIPLADNESVASGIEKLYAKLTSQTDL